VNDPFEIPLDTLKESESVNVLSSYVAAQQAVKGWKTLPANTKPTYIYTGNCANTVPLPIFTDLAVGKCGAAGFIAIAADAYKPQEFR
jgi:hypothetical protein